MRNQSKTTKILILSLSAVCVVLGMTALITEYVPERWTRFGLTNALYNKHAMLYGVTLLIISLLPLLIFCKTYKQGVILGSILFLLLMTTIFGGIYLVN